MMCQVLDARHITKLNIVPTKPEWGLGEPTALFIENVHVLF